MFLKLSFERSQSRLVYPINIRALYLTAMQFIILFLFVLGMCSLSVSASRTSREVRRRQTREPEISSPDRKYFHHVVNVYRRLQREKQGQPSVTETAKEVDMPRFRGSLKVQDSDALEKKKKNKRGGGAKIIRGNNK